MATKVMMEALSPTMEEGRLVKWLKAEGDAVKAGDTLAEVETDKAIMELVARGDGVLRARLIAEDTAVPVGQTIGVIGTADEDVTALTGGTARAPAAASAAPVGAAAGAGLELSPDGIREAAKSSRVAPEQVFAGPDGAREQAGTSSIPLTPEQQQGESSTPPQEKVAAHDTPIAPAGHDGEPVAPRAPAAANGRALASPLARRLASERGLEIGRLHGTGPNGRVIRRDVEAAEQTPAPTAPREQPRQAEVTPAVAQPAPAAGGYRDAALSSMRKTIARRLAESIGPVPTFYLTAEFDLGKVMELRQQLAAMGDEYKASVNDVILKATAVALSMHPEVNAHWLGDRIRYWDTVHLGMAVAIEDGLITPVIRDAQSKRLSQIGREAKALAARARDRKLKPDEFTGSTFSVSNLGMFGIDQFTAIINPPEAGILAVGAGEDKAVVENGAVVVRKRMRVTMSCDHRIIDGATGAKFLQTLRRLVENPLMLL